MASVLPTIEANVRFVTNGIGKCHFCSGGDVGDATKVVIATLRKENPDWFKEPGDRDARYLGHWVRFNFKPEFHAAVEQRANEILRREVFKPVVQFYVNDQPILVCGDCLTRFADGLNAEDECDAIVAGSDLRVPKRKPGRPKLPKADEATD